MKKIDLLFWVAVRFAYILHVICHIHLARYIYVCICVCVNTGIRDPLFTWIS